jgi:hypothetical protein
MVNNKKPNQKQAGEKPEGKYHFNPGDQSDKNDRNYQTREALIPDPPLAFSFDKSFDKIS